MELKTIALILGLPIAWAIAMVIVVLAVKYLTDNSDNSDSSDSNED